MRNNRQLFWGQGQFLTPQHLQQQDLFHLWQGQQHWRLAMPFGWGVVSLQVREEALEAGNFEVARCELVTREGLSLQAGTDCANPNATLAPRRFHGLMDPGGQPLSVYLGLPRHQAGQANLSSAQAAIAPGAVPPRFRLSTQERSDLYELDTPSAQLSFVEYNLPIFFDREEGFATAEQAAELVKISELVPVPAGTGARLSPAYIPPCLQIASSPVLATRIKAIRDLMTSKAQEYEGIKRQRQEPLRLLQMQTLNRYIPLLHHVVEVGRLHPESAYALLRQIVGELSVFSENVTGLGALKQDDDATSGEFAPYDHERLAWCFEPVVSRLQDLVRGLDAGAEAGIALVRDGRYYKAFLPPSIFETERARYYLMFDSSVRGDVLWQRLQKTAKVSPLEDMQRLLASALFGLKVDLEPIPPEDVPQRGGNKTFFRIDTKHPVWARIREQQNIAVFCDLDPNETAIKLFFVPDN
jgi:type VI secretion system ImpJ/VasE family protein